MPENIFARIGLTEGETKVYLALLELGSTTTGPVVHKSEISASKVYDILDRLTKKGLVSFIIKEKTKYFQAADPERILDYMDEKEQELAKQKKEISKIIPDLKLRQQLSETKQHAQIYEGRQGVMTALEKALSETKKDGTFYFMGASKWSSDTFRAFWQEHHQRCIKKGIKSNILFNRDVDKKELDKRNKFWGATAKYMPFDIVTPSWIEIFSDFVSIGVPSKNPVAVQIKNKEIAESFRNYFGALWNQKAVVTEGLDNIKKVFYSMLDEIGESNEFHVLGANRGELSNVSHKKVDDFFDEFHPFRKKLGIRAKLLFNHGREMDPKIYGGAEVTEIKTLPPSFRIPVQFNIYNKKIAIIIWKKNPIAITIEDEGVFNSLESYFQLLWNQKAVVYEGFEAVKSEFLKMIAEVGHGNEYLVLGANLGSWQGKPLKEMVSFFIDFHKKRREFGVKVKLLFNNQTKEDVQKLKSTYDNDDITKVKVLPPSLSVPVQFNLYNNKASIFLLKKEPVVFTIEDRDIYLSLKSYFDLLWNQDIQIYKGKDQVISLFEGFLDILTSDDKYYVFGANSDAGGLGDYLIDWDRRRSEKKVPMQIIFNENIRDRGEVMKKMQYTQVKYHPEDYASPVSFNIFRDLTSIFLWQKEPMAFVIKNQDIANAFIQNFNLLWDQNTWTYNGIEGIRSILEEAMDSSELLFIGGGGYLLDRMPQGYAEDYIKKRIKKYPGKTVWKNLVLPSMKNHPVIKIPQTENRFLPEGPYNPTVVYIYGNRVANVLWADEPIAFVVENSEVAEGYRNYFSVLWQNAKKIKN